MKTLIKTYYHEPQVDSDRIIKTLFSKNKEFLWSDVFFVPTIGMSVLLGIFGIFLLNLNFDFLSTGIRVYSAIGGILFIILNIGVGILLFISKYYSLMLMFSVILFFLQNIRIYQLQS